MKTPLQLVRQGAYHTRKALQECDRAGAWEERADPAPAEVANRARREAYAAWKAAQWHHAQAACAWAMLTLWLAGIGFVLAGVASIVRAL